MKPASHRTINHEFKDPVASGQEMIPVNDKM